MKESGLVGKRTFWSCKGRSCQAVPGQQLLYALLGKFFNTRRSQNSQSGGTHRADWSRPDAGMEQKKGRKAYTAIAWVCGHARGPFGYLNYGRGTIA